MSFNRNPWIAAQERYLDGLSDADKALYKEASVENLFYSASAAQIRHEKSSKSRAAAKKLQPLIAAISQYGSALDVLSNTSTMFFSPIWGGLRVLFHIASEFDKYYSKLVDMLERIGDVIPRFKAYERIFPTHEQLLYSLSAVYLDIINFCVDAKAIFQTAKNRKRSRFSFPGSGLRALKVLWKPFEQEFGSRIESFRRHTERVDLEAQVSHMAEQANESRRQGNERDAQALERRAAEKGRERQLMVYKEQTRHKLLQKLSKYDQEYKHRITKKMRVDGTGKWMLDSSEFGTWLLDPNSSFLWCHGIPGSGKTLVTTVIIDSIRDDHLLDGSPLIWFYCDYSEQKTLEPSEIVGSLVKQLLSIRVLEIYIDLQLQLEKIYDNDRTPDLDELFELLLLVISKYSRVHIIIDGLDECKEADRMNLFPLFSKLRSITTAIVKLMITSRDEVDIRKALADGPSIKTSIANTSSDMEIFVRDLVNGRLVGQMDWEDNETLIQDIIDALINGSQGMFLWVRFQVDDICQEISEEGVRGALKRLPQGLEGTFRRVLDKIKYRGAAQILAAKKVFMWLSCAQRVLSLEEMREAVSILPGEQGIERKRLPYGTQLIRSCGSLIVYDSQENTIKFAHHSVQEFLCTEYASNVPESDTTREFRFSSQDAHFEASLVCTTYLNFSVFQGAVSTFSSPSNEETKCLESATSEFVPQIANLSDSQTALWNIFRGIKGISTSKQSPEIDFNKHLRYVKKPEKNIMHDHKLLNYVLGSLLFHTSHLTIPYVIGRSRSSSDPPFSILFLDLVRKKKPLFIRFEPWSDVLLGHTHLNKHDYDSSVQTFAAPLIWALENGHHLLAFLTIHMIMDKFHGSIVYDDQPGNSRNKKSSQVIVTLMGYNENSWITLLHIIHFSSLTGMTAAEVREQLRTHPTTLALSVSRPRDFTSLIFGNLLRMEPESYYAAYERTVELARSADCAHLLRLLYSPSLASPLRRLSRLDIPLLSTRHIPFPPPPPSVDTL